MATTRKPSTRTRKPKATPAKPKVEPVEQAVKDGKRSVPANCGCGCGQPTITSKAAFLAGHDARHAGNLGRALAQDPTNTELLNARDALTDRLKAKVLKIQDTAARKIATKTARETAKIAAEKAYADALKEAGV